MTSPSPVELTVDQKSIQAVAKAFRAQEDGKALRKELIRTLKAEAEPTVTALKSSIESAPSRGISEGVSLRAAVARSIKPAVRLSGQNTGIAIRQSGTPAVRGFKMAGRRFNKGNFRRPVYGKAWTVQAGKPGWFDDEGAKHRDQFKEAALRAVQAMADEIAKRST